MLPLNLVNQWMVTVTDELPGASKSTNSSRPSNVFLCVVLLPDTVLQTWTFLPIDPSLTFLSYHSSSRKGFKCETLSHGTCVVVYSIISSTTKQTAAGGASKMKGGKGVYSASIQQKMKESWVATIKGLMCGRNTVRWGVRWESP